jgi:hypothetical protein
MNDIAKHLTEIEEAKASGEPFDGYFNATGTARVRYRKRLTPAKIERPVCDAKCRNGEACRARVCLRPDGQGLATRCRLHGGLTPHKPKSDQGRANIAAANRKRATTNPNGSS